MPKKQNNKNKKQTQGLSMLPRLALNSKTQAVRLP